MHPTGNERGSNSARLMCSFSLGALLALLFVANPVAGQSRKSGVLFTFGAYGKVDRANLTVNVTSRIECSLVCAKWRLCSIFSVTYTSLVGQNGMRSTLCELSYGPSSWTLVPNRTSELFVGKNQTLPVSELYSSTKQYIIYYTVYNIIIYINIFPKAVFNLVQCRIQQIKMAKNSFAEYEDALNGPSSGYKLQVDGAYYKFYENPVNSVLGSGRVCWQDRATSANPRPAAELGIIQSFPNISIRSFTVGYYRPDANYNRMFGTNYQGVSVTFDGR
jgi:hypothetical protein